MGVHDETRWGVLTGEFWTRRGHGWIVGVIASAYIVSRGLAKSGVPHRDPDRRS